MNNKSIYCVTGSIPTDEDIARVIIFKLIQLGRDKKRYVWITVNANHGIGTATDEWGDEDKASAIIQITNFLDEEFKFINGDFDEALEVYQEMSGRLTDEIVRKRLLALRTNE